MVIFSGLGFAQATTTPVPGLTNLLTFETPGDPLNGWIIDPSTISADDQVDHGGQWSARIQRTANSAGTISYLTTYIPLDFDADQITLRGWIRTENVDTLVAMWIREGQPSTSTTLSFATTPQSGAQALHGTTDWTQYSIDMPIKSGGERLAFGVFLQGTGTAWVDDMELLKTTYSPSGISVSSLSPMQIDNVTLLVKVWGFLKYHHSAIATGDKQFDFELFPVLKDVLDATTPEQAQTVIGTWVGGFGPSTPGSTIPPPSGDPGLSPPIGWIQDTSLLGTSLSQQLSDIYQNRVETETQTYVENTPPIGNPDFLNEPTYGGASLLDAGFQLIALARLWNMVEYWYPDRYLIDANDTPDQDAWDQVLHDFVPRFLLATTETDYELRLAELIATIQDSHAGVYGTAQTVVPPQGSCLVPVVLRVVYTDAGPVPVVEKYLGSGRNPVPELAIGDVITSVDGTKVSDLFNQWAPYYGASNQARRLFLMGQRLLAGDCVPANLSILRNGQAIDNVSPQRVSQQDAGVVYGVYFHDRPGDAFQMLSGNVAYLKISAAHIADVNQYLDQAAGTNGWIIDIRDYPSDFLVFALGQHLVQQQTPFVKFTFMDFSDPGASSFGQPVNLNPVAPTYDGHIVILVDEVTQSSAEYHAMAFRAAPDAVVIGSTTSGADGNVSKIDLPGGAYTYISGLGVFYPDGTPTQRVGIVPDIFVRPTVEGIRDGRDEVLERALEYIQSRSRPAREQRRANTH